MPRQKAGIRLWQRPATGIWIIRDSARGERSTRTRDRAIAEEKLAAYIVEQGLRSHRRSSPDQLTIADALKIYAQDYVAQNSDLRDPERLMFAIEAMLPLIGSRLVSDITGGLCRRYARERNRAPGTVRKELGTLQTALNFCADEGFLTHAPRVQLPSKPAPRDRWLTRDEAAQLLRAAYSDRETRHLSRFILVALYTGTRSQAILGLQFMPNTSGGWVDVDRGILHRRAAGATETKKRQPPIPIPVPLLAHLRRWKRQGGRYVVAFRGQRVGSIKSAWRRALVRSGIEHCTKHDLRHTAITWAMQGGIDRYEAAGYFGVTMDTLERVYAHHHSDYLRSAADLMGRGGRKRPVSAQFQRVKTA